MSLILTESLMECPYCHVLVKESEADAHMCWEMYYAINGGEPDD